MLVELGDGVAVSDGGGAPLVELVGVGVVSEVLRHSLAAFLILRDTLKPNAGRYFKGTK